MIKYKPLEAQAEANAAASQPQDTSQLAHHLLAAAHQANPPIQSEQLVTLLQHTFQDSSSLLKPKDLARLLQSLASQPCAPSQNASAASPPKMRHSFNGSASRQLHGLAEQAGSQHDCVDLSHQPEAISDTISVLNMMHEDNSNDSSQPPQRTRGSTKLVNSLETYSNVSSSRSRSNMLSLLEINDENSNQDANSKLEEDNGDKGGIFSMGSYYTPSHANFAGLKRSHELAVQTPMRTSPDPAYFPYTPPTSTHRARSNQASTPNAIHTPTRQPRSPEGLARASMSSAAPQSGPEESEESSIPGEHIPSQPSTPSPQPFRSQDHESIIQEAENPSPLTRSVSRRSSAKTNVSRGQNSQSLPKTSSQSQRAHKPLNFYIEIPTLASYRRASRVAKERSKRAKGKGRLAKRAKEHLRSNSSGPIIID